MVNLAEEFEEMAYVFCGLTRFIQASDYDTNHVNTVMINKLLISTQIYIDIKKSLNVLSILTNNNTIVCVCL